MPSVTVLGSGGTTLSLPFSSTQQYQLAQLLANSINSRVMAGTLTPVNSTGISSPTLSAGQSGELVLGGTPDTEILTPGYKAVVANTSGWTLLGPGETDQLIFSSGSLNFFSGGGSGTVLAGGGGSTVNVTSTIPGAGWLVSTGQGGNQILALSGNDTIVPGTGSNSVQLGTGNDLVESSGQDTIQAGSGADTVVVQSGGNDVVYGGSGALTFVGSGSGSSTVIGGQGSETVFGSSAPGYYSGGAAGNNLIYGAGTLLGGGSGDALYATGSAPTLLTAGLGNETLSAALSTGADTINTSSGNDSIFLGSNDLVTFTKGQAGGTDTVLNLTGTDTITLNGYAPGEAKADLAAAQVTSAGVVVTLSDNTKITFSGVTNPNTIKLQ